jgi:hypothetical protein
MAKRISDLALTIDPFSQINDTQFGGGASLGSLYAPGSSNEISSPKIWANVAKQSLAPKLPEAPEAPSNQSQPTNDNQPSKDIAPAQDVIQPVDNAPNPYLPPTIDFTIPEIPPLNADLTPDLTAVKVPNLPPVDVVAPDLTAVKVPDLPPVDVVAPDLTGTIDFTVPEIPPLNADLTPDLTAVKAPDLPPVGVIAPDLNKLIDPARKELDKINIDLGIPPGLMDDASLKVGDPTKFGQIGVPGTGGYVDVTDRSNKLYDEVVVGTPLEGVSADDVLSLVREPKQFVIDKGSDVAAEAINNMTGGGGDSLLGGGGATGEVIADLLKGTPIGEVTGDIAKNAIVDTTRIEVTKQFGNDAGGAAAEIIAGILEGENADQIAIDIAKNAIEQEAIKQGGKLVGGSAVTIINDILAGKNADVIAVDVAVGVGVELVGTALDTVMPGVGTLFKIVAPFLMNLFGGGGDTRTPEQKAEQLKQNAISDQHSLVVSTAMQQGLADFKDEQTGNIRKSKDADTNELYRLLLSGKPGSQFGLGDIIEQIYLNNQPPHLVRLFVEKLASRGITLNSDKKFEVRKDIADNFYANEKQAKADKAIQTAIIAKDAIKNQQETKNRMILNSQGIG